MQHMHSEAKEYFKLAFKDSEDASRIQEVQENDTISDTANQK